MEEAVKEPDTLPQVLKTCDATQLHPQRSGVYFAQF